MPEKFKTLIGGQALIEGVMMRGTDKQSIVVRSKDGIVTKVEELKLIKDKYPILGLPFIRGVVNFGSSMINGVKALMYSADFFPDDESLEPSKLDKWIEKKLGSEKAEQVIIYLAFAIGIAFSIGLFILLPTLIAGLVDSAIESFFIRNLIEGVIRIAIFLTYIIAISKMKDIKRVYSYHGAEHKSIACYEAGLELTIENARGQGRLHPRCGTSFLFVVMIISILVFSVIEWSNPLMRIVLRLALLPVVVAIAYEINRFIGRHDNRFTRIIRAPGMWLQNFTTCEPEDGMLEVALTALKLVLPEEKGKDEW